MLQCPPRECLIRYASALVAVGIAGAITFALVNVLSSSLALLFIAAVMLVALYAGLGPGLLASVLSASAFYYLTPRPAGSGKGDYLLQLTVFVCVAFLISWLSSARRKSEESLRVAHGELEARVRERTAELDAAVVKLQDEVAERKRVENEILQYQNRLRSLATELSVTEERERRRIATTLHDGVGHRLALAVIKMQGLLQSRSLDGDAHTMRSTCHLIEEAIEHTRSLTLQLSPPVLFELGLLPALEWLATRLEADHDLHVHVSDLGTQAALTDEQRAFLFSTARELLINVVKHADAENAWVTLQTDDQRLQMEVEDDGKGCESDALRPSSSAGFGLFNIRERTTNLGGGLDVSSVRGSSCRVSLWIPVRTVAEAEKA